LYCILVCNGQRRICHHTARRDATSKIIQLVTANDEKDHDHGKIENGEEECLRESDHCYALWVEDNNPNSTGVTYIGQGNVSNSMRTVRIAKLLINTMV